VKTQPCIAIGLTGGIASGKSAASNKFADMGIPVIDADIIAREVVEPKSKGLQQLVNAFGQSILDGEKLDRSKLRAIVFNDSEKLKQINAILHPLIGHEIRKQVNVIKQHYCIVVIPLLCESTRYDWLDRVLVIDVSKETQTKRLLKRDAITIELANKMLDSQCSREQRLAIADDVLNNEKDLKQLYQHIERLHLLYKSL